MKNENPTFGALALKPNQKMYCIYWWDSTAGYTGKWKYVRNVSKHYTKAVNTFIDYCKSNSIKDFYICEQSSMRDYNTSKTGRKAENVQQFYQTMASQGIDEVVLNEIAEWVEENCFDGFLSMRRKLAEEINDLTNVYPTDWEIVKSKDISNLDAAKFINCMAARKTFAWDIFRNIYEKAVAGKDLTPAQINLFTKIIAQFPSDADVAKKSEKYLQIRNDYLKELASMRPIQKSGFKQCVEGTITKAKLIESEYGMQTKIFVKDNKGYTVYGTCPKVIVDTLDYDEKGYLKIDDLTGIKVKFSARVTKANGEQFFGFYQRPTKVEMVQM